MRSPLSRSVFAERSKTAPRPKGEAGLLIEKIESSPEETEPSDGGVVLPGEDVEVGAELASAGSSTQTKASPAGNASEVARAAPGRLARRLASLGSGAVLGALALAVAAPLLLPILASIQRERIAEACEIAKPLVLLATHSKYDDEDAASDREDVLRPVRLAIRAMGEDAAGTAEARDCARAGLLTWMREGALTRMKTKDANLTRSRLVAEMALAAVALDADRPWTKAERKTIDRWGSKVARTTTRFFNRKAGDMSRANNHRYWAALAVGALGHVTDRPEWRAWGRESAAIGLCAVTEEGHLPLELARGERAMRYHLYALRPLAAHARLDAGRDEAVRPACTDGLERLAAATLAMIEDPSGVEALTGKRQLPPPDEGVYGPFLRFAEGDIAVIAGRKADRVLASR